MYLLVLLGFHRFLDLGGRIGKVRSNGSRLFLGIGHGGINSGLVLFQEIFQKAIVQELGPPGLWQEGPEEECQLEGVVERDPVEQKVGKDFNDGEESKNDPIDEPLRVVSLDLGFDGLKRLEGGVDESNNAAEGTSADAEEDDND